MLFSSVPFLFYFLPCVLLVYFLVPGTLKNGVLLLASLLFYGWGEPRYLLVMLAEIAQGYVFGLLIEKSRGKRRAGLYLALSVLLSLGTLAYFKYADFMIRNLNALTGLSVPLLSLALPVGISFYTFQILSYTVDVYRGTVPAQRNLIDLAAYIAMFPQLIAGPIVRYSDIAPELRSRTHTLSDAAAGTRRFVLGLAKKILFANLLGELVSGFRASQEQSVLYFWLGAAAFTLQIYYDFSSYSDMAIGLGRILGFHFPENFRYPYCAGSITEFWRRWHISLGSWFRDWRQPEGERTAAAEHSSRLAGDRPVARGGLDIRSVGTSVCGAADGRKAVFAARAEKAPRAQPHLCAAVRHARLRAL